MKLPIIGVVENMSEFVCPKCHKASNIFPPTSGGAASMCKELSVPFLIKIPLDPLIAKCCDDGVSIFVEHPESSTAKAYDELCKMLISICEKVDTVI